MADRIARDYGFGQDFDPAPGTRTSRTGVPTPFQVTPPVDYGDMTRAPRDQFAPPIAAPIVPPGSYYPQYPYAPYAPPPEAAPAPVTPATPAAFAGSPLNTMYGIDSESYLTEDQRKLARMIQGKFDASLQRRDRELAQYGAPRLASFTEDEALARAMSLARGLNIPVQDALGMVQGTGPASRGGGGSGGGGPGGGSPRVTAPTAPRAPTNPTTAAAKTTPPGASPDQFAKWQKIVAGLSSVLPLLLGKEGMEKGLFSGIKNWLSSKHEEIFPGTNMTEAQLDRLLDAQDANGSWDEIPGVGYNELQYPLPDNIPGPPIDPYAGELMGPPAYLAGGDDPFSYWDVPGDAVDPWAAVDPYGDIPWWEGGDYGYGGFDPSWLDWGYDPTTFMGPI